jgi:RNA recognition motif-containing protein
VRFFDIRSAYALVRSTIRVRGFKWLVQFGRYESTVNQRNPPNARTIIIFRVAASTTEDMLRTKFSEFGEVRQIREWNAHRFVEFWDSRSATKAIKSMHGKKVFGVKTSIELCRPSGIRQNSRAYTENKMPTVARVNKKAKHAVKFELARDSPISRATRNAKPSLTFSSSPRSVRT